MINPYLDGRADYRQPSENKEEKKSHKKATRFARNFSTRDLKNIKCYKCGRLGHLANNCKAEKFKALQLDEPTQDKLYELFYESDSDSSVFE